MNKQYHDPNYFTEKFNFFKALTAIYHLSRKYSKEEISNILNAKDKAGITSLFYVINHEYSYWMKYSPYISLLQNYGNLIPYNQLLTATENIV